MLARYQRWRVLFRCTMDVTAIRFAQLVSACCFGVVGLIQVFLYGHISRTGLLVANWLRASTPTVNLGADLMAEQSQAGRLVLAIWTRRSEQQSRGDLVWH